MKYYKIIVDNTFIGAIHSGALRAENPNSHRLFVADETEGQFVDYEGQLYRDYWMHPVDTERAFIEAKIEEIDEEEYNILIQAIENNETIVIEDEEPQEYIRPVEDEAPDITLEYVRAGKLKEMSTTCRQIIESGFDIELRGEVHHFSLNTQDQLNLISLSAMAQTQQLIPYHADGEACIFYTNEEISEIVETATAFKIYHTTYYNALKGYINALNTVETIAAIQYGTPIPEEYKSDVLRMLEQ